MRCETLSAGVEFNTKVRDGIAWGLGDRAAGLSACEGSRPAEWYAGQDPRGADAPACAAAMN